MTYNFEVSFDQDIDGRWSAWLTSYPACGTWGYTKDEAAEALAEMTVVFLEVMQDSGEPVYADSVGDTYQQVADNQQAIVASCGFGGMAVIGGETVRIPMAV